MLDKIIKAFVSYVQAVIAFFAIGVCILFSLFLWALPIMFVVYVTLKILGK